MKKILTSFVLALWICPLVLASFEDVSSVHKNRIAIEYLQKENIISGYSDNTYRPENTINRAEMMKMLVEGLSMTPDSKEYKNCFPDVNEEWFAPYICYAKEKGWVNGYPDGSFKPSNNVLDVEAFKMILNARKVELDPDFTPLKFATVNPDAWYRPYLVTAEKMNLTESFKPGANYKRGEVAEVIFRTLVIDKMDVNAYSLQAQNDLINQENIKPEISYEAASYIEYSNEKREEYEGNRPFAIFFHASDCSTCRNIEDELEANLKSYPDGVMILKADYDTAQELREEFSVTSQYWFVIFDNEGKINFSGNIFNASDLIDQIIETL